MTSDQGRAVARVAAYQAPLGVTDPSAAVDLLREQLDLCDRDRVEVVCCPEAYLGGLADYASEPARHALDVGAGDLHRVTEPLARARVAVILGFTERGSHDRLYNAAAVLHRGRVLGVYRKLYPAINRSVYSAGDTLPVFRVGSLTFGVTICLDSNYFAPARILAARGAAAMFVPTNNAMPVGKGVELVSRARAVDTARALENRLSVVRADVVGEVGNLRSAGASGIVDPDGALLAVHPPFRVGLIVGEVETAPRNRRPAWNPATNPRVAEAYDALSEEWRTP